MTRLKILRLGFPPAPGRTKVTSSLGGDAPDPEDCVAKPSGRYHSLEDAVRVGATWISHHINLGTGLQRYGADRKGQWQRVETRDLEGRHVVEFVQANGVALILVTFPIHHYGSEGVPDNVGIGEDDATRCRHET